MAKENMDEVMATMVEDEVVEDTTTTIRHVPNRCANFVPTLVIPFIAAGRDSILPSLVKKRAPILLLLLRVLTLIGT